MKSAITLGLLLFLLTSFYCVADESKSDYEKDFDHDIHFKLVKTENGRYQLTVARLGNPTFAQMNVFVTRKGRSLCGESKPFSITYLDGIEAVNEKDARPNFIFPSLEVIISCS